MATATFTPLATITLGSSASSVSFASIPTSYNHLVLSAQLIGTGSGNLYYTDSGSGNYKGTGWRLSTTAILNRDSASSVFFQSNGGINATNWATIWMEMLNRNQAEYAVRSYATDSSGGGEMWLWDRGGTLTSFTINSTISQFAAGTTFSLFGLVGN